VVHKGVTWNVGRTFYRDDEVFSFNLRARPGHHRPGMVNLQQYYLEEYLVARVARAAPASTCAGRTRSRAVTPGARRRCRCRPPEGATRSGRLADRRRRRAQPDPPHAGAGHRRQGLPGPLPDRRRGDEGRLFPAERWFWFDPPFHPGQSVLLHREADNVWRIDFQLGWDADPERRRSPRT
jgi:3-(3-hydroxy-phenyl)propionate hydroxylase